MNRNDTIRKIRDGVDILDGGLRDLTLQIERLMRTVEALRDASNLLAVELDGIEDE